MAFIAKSHEGVKYIIPLHYVKTITRDPTNRGYEWSAPVWTGKVAQAPDHILTAPLRWKKPRRVFVNSMGDLFHESIPDAWIDRVFAVMALSPQHTFQVLTKRAERADVLECEIEITADFEGAWNDMWSKPFRAGDGAA